MPTDPTTTVIDATTAVSAEVVGEAPGFAMGSVFQASGQAFSLMMLNAAAAQHGLQQIQIATVSAAVAKIMSMAPSGKG